MSDNYERDSRISPCTDCTRKPRGPYWMDENYPCLTCVYYRKFYSPIVSIGGHQPNPCERRISTVRIQN